MEEALDTAGEGERFEKAVCVSCWSSTGPSRCSGVRHLTDGSRLENDGEHMWHAMLAGLVLAEHADDPVDPLRLALMLAVHDIVEIDAGDTFVYASAEVQADKVVREKAAAERIFGLLPEDRPRHLRVPLGGVRGTRDSARPHGGGHRPSPAAHDEPGGQARTWREHGISAGQVFTVNSRIGEGSSTLWSFALRRPRGGRANGLFEA